MNEKHTQTPSFACQLDADQHCLTCSDEALPVRVLQVDQQACSALVEIGDQTEEIDIMLMENVIPGDLLLAHAGVAIARLEEERPHVC